MFGPERLSDVSLGYFKEHSLDYLNWQTLDGWAFSTNMGKITFISYRLQYLGIFMWRQEPSKETQPIWYPSIVAMDEPKMHLSSEFEQSGFAI